MEPGIPLLQRRWRLNLKSGLCEVVSQMQSPLPEVRAWVRCPMPEILYQIWGELILAALSISTTYECTFLGIIKFEASWLDILGCLRRVVGLTDCPAFKFAQNLGLTLNLRPGWWHEGWTLWGLDKRLRHKCLRSAVRLASWCDKPR